MNTSNDSEKINLNKFSGEAFSYSVIFYLFLAFLIGLFSTKIEFIHNNLGIVKAVLLMFSVWFYYYIKKTLIKSRAAPEQS